MSHPSTSPVDGLPPVAALRSAAESGRFTLEAADPSFGAAVDAAADAAIDESVHEEVMGELIGQTALLSLHFMSQELMRLRAQTEERFRELRQDEG